MGVRIYSVKVNSQAGKIWLHVMATQKRPKPHYSAWGLKDLRILPENVFGASSPGESDAGVTYISLRILPKMSF